MQQKALKAEFENQLLLSQIEVQEATFSTLGKELHDNVGQLLGTAKMLIGVSQRNLSSSADTIKTAEDTLTKAIHELRSLSKTLDKDWLEQFNFRENLCTEIARINSSGIIAVSLTDSTADLGLSSKEQIILFRIVQEALQNAVKHANATRIDIEIGRRDQAHSIVICDDGKGFGQSLALNGVGTLNMKHRAKLLDANISWEPAPRGTAVKLSLPLKEIA